MAFLSLRILVFGGWSFIVNSGSIPIFGEVLFIFNFYYIDSVSILRSGVLGFNFWKDDTVVDTTFEPLTKMTHPKNYLM